MQIRMKIGPKYFQSKVPQAGQSLIFTLPIPRLRLWVVLLILALPFVIVSEKYLETLERTGPGSALIADMTMSAIIVGYPALLWVLKKRKL